MTRKNAIRVLERRAAYLRTEIATCPDDHRGISFIERELAAIEAITKETSMIYDTIQAQRAQDGSVTMLLTAHDAEGLETAHQCLSVTEAIGAAWLPPQSDPPTVEAPSEFAEALIG
jgi:hypothetical protein